MEGNHVKKYKPEDIVTWGPIRFNMTKEKDRLVYEAIKDHDGFKTESKFVKEVILDYIERKEAAELRRSRKQNSMLEYLPPADAEHVLNENE